MRDVEKWKGKGKGKGRAPWDGGTARQKKQMVWGGVSGKGDGTSRGGSRSFWIYLS